MSKTKTHALSLLVILTLAWLSSCGEKAKEDCAEHIRETIRQGTPLQVAQDRLKQCGFRTTLDQTKSILYADRMKEGKPVSKRTQVIVKLDSERRVVEVRVSSGLIAP